MMSAVALANVVRRGIAGDRRSRDRARAARRRATAVIYGATLAICAVALFGSLRWLLGGNGRCLRSDPADRIAVAWRAFPPGRAGFVFPRCRQSGRRGGKPLRSRLRPSRAGAASRAAVLPRLSGRHESGGAGGRCVLLSAVLGIHVAGVLGAGDGASPRSRQRQGRLRLSRDGKLRHAGAAAGLRPAGGTGGRLRIRGHSRRAAHALRGGAGVDPDAARRRIEGRPGAAACLAAARPSGGAEPRFGADERRHDQGRDLRLHSRRLRSRWDRRPGRRA